MDVALYEKCQRENTEKQKKQEAEREASNQKWKAILDNAAASGIDVDNL